MNKHVQTLFDNSPVWAQNAMISYYGLGLLRTRYGATYRNARRWLDSKNYSDLQTELDYQNAELRRLLRHAGENSEFYRELYQGIDLSKIQTVEDLKLLPLVDKEMLRTNAGRAATVEEKDGIVAFTGGTTGKSLKVVYTRDDMQNRMAYLDAFKQRLGVDPFNTKKATFSGRQFTKNVGSERKRTYWRNNYPYRQRLYSTYDLTEVNMPYYLADLNRYRPDVLNGFVSAIYEIATYVERNGAKLDFTPQAVFTTSETLLPHHREVIERVFKTRIYDQYSSGEGAPFVTECAHGSLHYNLDTGVIEVIETEDGPDIAVTAFFTYGTPLIRYRIGDKIVFGEGTCPCGSCHPIVKAIEGRKVDFLYSPEYGKVSMSHLSDVIKGMPNCIKCMQFVQEEIDRIRIKLVVDEALYTKEHEASIRAQMAYRFGRAVEVPIELVDEIPRAASGKFPIVVNRLKEIPGAATQPA